MTYVKTKPKVESKYQGVVEDGTFTFQRYGNNGGTRYTLCFQPHESLRRQYGPNAKAVLAMDRVTVKQKFAKGIDKYAREAFDLNKMQANDRENLERLLDGLQDQSKEESSTSDWDHCT